MLRDRILKSARSKYVGRSASERIDTFIREASIDFIIDNDQAISILEKLDLNPIPKKEDSHEPSN